MKKIIFALVLALLLFAGGALAQETLPKIWVETEGEQEVLSREEFVPCTVTIQNGEDSVQAQAGIRVRGNTSAYNGDVDMIRENQVPYKLKFSEKINLLGLNNGYCFKDWVLLVADYDLVHTDAIFRLGRAMGSFFTPDSRLVEVYLNGEPAGQYLLCDQKEIKKHRVELNEPEEDEKSTATGYWVEIDHYAGKKDGFTVHYDDGAELTDLDGVTKQPVQAGYTLQSDFYSKKQLQFIEKYINNMYILLRRACQLGEYYTLDDEAGLVPCEAASAEEAIGRVFNLDAAVDMYILQEMARNGDVGKGSFFMSVDLSPEAEDHRLCFNTPWDFTMVVEQGVEGFHAACFFHEDFVMENGDNANPWFILLMGQDWFREKVRARLAQLREDGTLDRVFAEEAEMIETYRDDLTRDDDEDWAIDGPDGAFEGLNWMRERLSWLEDTLTVMASGEESSTNLGE